MVWLHSRDVILYARSKENQKLFFKADNRLMQVKSIAECSKGSILQYFLPSLSCHLSLRSLFCLLLSGHLRQVLLYANVYGPFGWEMVPPLSVLSH